jgi:hypothetical protein
MVGIVMFLSVPFGLLVFDYFRWHLTSPSTRSYILLRARWSSILTLNRTLLYFFDISVFVFIGYIKLTLPVFVIRTFLVFHVVVLTPQRGVVLALLNIELL